MQETSACHPTLFFAPSSQSQLSLLSATPLAHAFNVGAIGRYCFLLAGLECVLASERANADAGKVHFVFWRVLGSDLLHHALANQGHMRAGSFDLLFERVGERHGADADLLWLRG